MHAPFCRLVLIPAALALLLAPLAAFAEDTPAPEDEKAQAAALIKEFHSKDLEVRLKAAEDAKHVQHASLTSPLIKLLSDKERGVREAAIDALSLREDPKARKRAAIALAARLKHLGGHPADRPDLMQIVSALRTLARPEGIDALLDGIDLETELEEVEARLFAVAEVPHKKAIEALIDFLAKGRRGGRQKQRALANKALHYATGSKPGEENRNAGRDADRWRAWWRENEKDFDFEAVAAARAEAAARAKEREARKKKGKRGDRKGKKGKDAPKKEGGGSKVTD